MEALLERYNAYLTGERGRAGLTAGDVTGFVLAAAPLRAKGSAKLLVTALRSLLRFLHMQGLTGSR